VLYKIDGVNIHRCIGSVLAASGNYSRGCTHIKFYFYYTKELKIAIKIVDF
jgi:hypothetical protein